MTTQERRKSGRIDSLNLSYLLVDSEQGEAQKQTMGRTLDVSEDGIRLETHIPVHVGSHILVSIGLEDDVVDINGKAIHSSKNESGKYELGIEFRDIDDVAEKILKAFIRAFRQHHGSDH
jgi:c-di-GMP-binding flagellar brake protein YcgR